ncbi:MAG TPA: antitoxin family protein [Gemmataceae bacterium]|jgi:predicted DNA-binding antitoxin AbrB/MazE fold protein|nr:antitoxin family protein [Gemmataceae bacterium]
MSITVDATYENGTLKLERPLPLKEHEKVRVTVETTLTWAERTAGMMGFKGSAEEAEYFANSPDLDFPDAEDDA